MLTFHFNLREPNKKTETPLYLIVKVEQKQIKIPLGIKIAPHLWDKRRQEIRFSHDLSVAAVQNLTEKQKKIFQIRLGITELCSYVCNNSMKKIDKEFIINYFTNIKTFKWMANRNPKKRTTTASKILREAFELFYVRTTKNRAESTVIENKKRLKNFLEFIKGRDSIDRLNQDTINEYRDSMIKKRLSANRINTCGGTICRLINFLGISSEFKKYGRKFESVRFTNVEDQRNKDEKKSQALEDWEAEKIRHAKGLTEKEEFYRDCFVMQLETGVRKSDVEKLFNGQYDTTEENGKTALIIKTKKSKRQQIRAIIVCNETISALQEKYREKKVKINESEYNKNLKSIARKAGLTHEIEYQESKGEGTKKKREPQCDAFTSHWGRHTFITKKCREGYSPESVIKLTGHTSEKMVREIYSHLKPNDIAKQVLQTEIERENEEKNISDSGAYEFIARQSIEIDKLKSKIKKDESLSFIHNIQAQRTKIAEKRANDIWEMWENGLTPEDAKKLDDEADIALMEG